MFALFLTGKVCWLCMLVKSFSKTFNGGFRFEKLIVAYIDMAACFCLKNKKSWNIFKVKLPGSKVKCIRPYLNCHNSALACVTSPLSMIKETGMYLVCFTWCACSS